MQDTHKFRPLPISRSDKRMTLPSRFQKEVRTHLSRDPEQIHGESLLSLNAQDQEIGTRL